MADEDKKVEEKVEAPVEEAKTEAPTEEKTEVKKEDTPTEATSAEEAEEVEVPAKFKKLIEEVEGMTVLELHELVKILEKKFGVSAAAVAVAGPAVGGDGDGGEQSDFTIELTSMGDQKIAVIKAVKEILALGLKEAKDLVESAPVVLKEGVKKEDAEEMKTKVEAAGGTVTLK